MLTSYRRNAIMGKRLLSQRWTMDTAAPGTWNAQKPPEAQPRLNRGEKKADTPGDTPGEHSSKTPAGGEVPHPASSLDAASFSREAGSQSAPAGIAAGNEAPDMPQKDAIIEKMIGTKAGKLSDEEMIKIKKALRPVDAAVLEKTAAYGVKIEVARSGKPITDLGIIRTIDVKEEYANMAPLAQQSEKAIEEHGEKIDMEIKKLIEEHGKRKDDDRGFGFNFGSDTRTPLERDAEGVRLKYQKDLGKALYEGSDQKIKLFDGTPQKDHGDMKGFMIMPRDYKPVSSPRDMAEAHGAKTPGEIREFAKRVNELNGPRLEKAQRDTIEKIRKTEPERARELEKKLQEDPDGIPLDTLEHPVAVPNLFYQRFKGEGDDKPGRRVDLHDFKSIIEWTDKEGKLQNIADLPPGTRGYIQGQYFFDPAVKTILLRDDLLNDERLIIHETGHAYENALKESNPGFYAGFKKERDDTFRAFCSDNDSTSFVSSYARTNEDEFFAESFNAYYADPALLKSRSPEWFKSFRESVRVADTQEIPAAPALKNELMKRVREKMAGSLVTEPGGQN